MLRRRRRPRLLPEANPFFLKPSDAKEREPRRSQREALLCVRRSLDAALHWRLQTATNMRLPARPNSPSSRLRTSAEKRNASASAHACRTLQRGRKLETRISRRASDSARSYSTPPFQSLLRAQRRVRATLRSLLALSPTPTASVASLPEYIAGASGGSASRFHESAPPHIHIEAQPAPTIRSLLDI